MLSPVCYPPTHNFFPRCNPSIDGHSLYALVINEITIFFRYFVRNRGKGDNFLKDEQLIQDPDHKFYRQHGQRVRKTEGGGERLYLDQRLAETNDVVGKRTVSHLFASARRLGSSACI